LDDNRLSPFQEKLRISTIKQTVTIICRKFWLFQIFIPDNSNKTYEFNQVFYQKKKLKEVDVDGIVENLRVKLIDTAFLGLHDINNIINYLIRCF
jgi:hypothetical protein